MYGFRAKLATMGAGKTEDLIRGNGKFEDLCGGKLKYQLEITHYH